MNKLVSFSGTSMLPLLKSGDKLILSDQFKSELKEFDLGDVVLYYDGAQAVAHRVVSVENVMLLKGDRSVCLDANIEHGMFIPVLGFVREGREVVWGNQGQPFKKTIAKLSTYFEIDRNRFVRRVVAAAILFFTHASEIKIYLRGK